MNFSQTIALFGGSFDPPHLGHLHIAREILQQMPELEKMVFVPCAQSPGKRKAVASAEQRLDFLKIALNNTPFALWDFEVRAGKESYTVNTVREAHRQGAKQEKLFWILGADAYAHFSQWQEPETIRSHCRLLVVNRPNHPLQQQNAQDKIITIPPSPLSSTSLRESLAKGKSPINSLPQALEDHLRKLTLHTQNPYGSL